jgi:predicted permease
MAFFDLLVPLTLLAEQAPEPEDVTAGWTALLVFLLLIAAVVFLGFSLVKQLRKAQAAKDAGVFDDPGSGEDKPESGTP